MFFIHQRQRSDILHLFEYVTCRGPGPSSFKRLFRCLMFTLPQMYEHRNGYSTSNHRLRQYSTCFCSTNQPTVGNHSHSHHPLIHNHPSPVKAPFYHLPLRSQDVWITADGHVLRCDARKGGIRRKYGPCLRRHRGGWKIGGGHVIDIGRTTRN